MNERITLGGLNVLKRILIYSLFLIVGLAMGIGSFIYDPHDVINYLWIIVWIVFLVFLIRELINIKSNTNYLGYDVEYFYIGKKKYNLNDIEKIVINRSSEEYSYKHVLVRLKDGKEIIIKDIKALNKFASNLVSELSKKNVRIILQ